MGTFLCCGAVGTSRWYVASLALRRIITDELWVQEDSDPFAAKLKGARGPREAKPRTELAMTASGPMGQGPGGARASSSSPSRPTRRLI